jgi:hypothetical protein
MTAVHEQAAAAQALVAILTAFPHLPAAELDVTALPGAGQGVRISTHDQADHFERWREALDVDPARINLVALTPDLHVMRGWSSFAGVPVQLLGFLDLLDPTAALAA